MKIHLFLPLFALWLFACKSDPTEKIRAAEATFSTSASPENADRLIAALTEFLQNNGDDRPACFRFSTRIADLALGLHDPRKTVAAAGDALAKFGDGQDRTPAVELLAEVWHLKFSKNGDALLLEPSDEKRMTALLANNAAWLDTALARAEARVMVDSTAQIDKMACSKFVRRAECAAFFAKKPEKAADLLFSAAEKAMAAEQFAKSVALFERVETEFSGQKTAANALFLKAFVLENHLGELEKARAAYQLFLKKHPADDLAESARQSLRLLGKSEEELIREFEKRLAAGS